MNIREGTVKTATIVAAQIVPAGLIVLGAALLYELLAPRTHDFGIVKSI